MLGLAVVGVAVGLEETVGEVVLEEVMETSAQFQNSVNEFQ